MKSNKTQGTDLSYLFRRQTSRSIDGGHGVILKAGESS